MSPTVSTPTKTSSAGGATLLIGLQVGSRALTFSVNQILLRFLRPELLGISTQLEVYSISVLFFARESLRVAIQRQGDTCEDVSKAEGGKHLPNGAVRGRTAGGTTQALVNLAYISIFLGALFSVVLAWLYLRTLEKSGLSILETPYFRESLQVFGLSAFIELLSEPCFVVVQQKSLYKIRATAEGVGTICRCLATSSSAFWAARTGRDIGVLPFALGQAIYSVALSAVYLWNVSSIASAHGFSLVPQQIYSSDNIAFVLSYFPRSLLVLGTSIFTQSIVKHMLTQGDTIIIASLASPTAQGSYALANNYGGLIARLIFQPVEESSRNHFGKLLATTEGPPSKDHISQATKDLRTLLRAYLIFSIGVLSIGPTIAPLLLNIVAGPRWSASGAGQVLATYCYYIPLLALNGVTEAFVSSVATETEVNRQSVWMLAFSVGFSGAAFLFLRILGLGAQGLVWANILNMTFRIAWSSNFIRGYLKGHGTDITVVSLLPRPLTIAFGVGSYGVLYQINQTITGGLSDFIKVGTISGIFVFALAVSERAYFIDCYRSVKRPAS